MIVSDAGVATLWSVVRWMGAPVGASAPCVSTRRVLRALPGELLSPMLGPVPDGGRHGFTAAVAVVAPIV